MEVLEELEDVDGRAEPEELDDEDVLEEPDGLAVVTVVTRRGEGLLLELVGVDDEREPDVVTVIPDERDAPDCAAAVEVTCYVSD